MDEFPEFEIVDDDFVNGGKAKHNLAVRRLPRAFSLINGVLSLILYKDPAITVDLTDYFPTRQEVADEILPGLGSATEPGLLQLANDEVPDDLQSENKPLPAAAVIRLIEAYIGLGEGGGGNPVIDFLTSYNNAPLLDRKNFINNVLTLIDETPTLKTKFCALVSSCGITNPPVDPVTVVSVELFEIVAEDVTQVTVVGIELFELVADDTPVPGLEFRIVKPGGSTSISLSESITEAITQQVIIQQKWSDNTWKTYTGQRTWSLQDNPTTATIDVYGIINLPANSISATTNATIRAVILENVPITALVEFINTGAPAPSFSAGTHYESQSNAPAANTIQKVQYRYVAAYYGSGANKDAVEVIATDTFGTDESGISLRLTGAALGQYDAVFERKADGLRRWVNFQGAGIRNQNLTIWLAFGPPSNRTEVHYDIGSHSTTSNYVTLYENPNNSGGSGEIPAYVGITNVGASITGWAAGAVRYMQYEGNTTTCSEAITFFNSLSDTDKVAYTSATVPPVADGFGAWYERGCSATGPFSVKLEAEAMTTGTGSSYADENASGGQIRGNYGNVNEYVVFSGTVPVSGTYNLDIRHQTNFEDGVATLTAIVNNGSPFDLILDAHGGGKATITTAVTLNAGAFTIRIQGKDTGNEHSFLLDAITLTKV